jgi:hypothetical protein
MDEYMRENKLDGIAPVMPRAPTGAAKASAPKSAASAEEEAEEEDADVPRPKKKAE